MRIKPVPSKKFLDSILRYDPESGKLFWRPRPLTKCVSLREYRRWNSRYANKEAGLKCKDDVNGLFYRRLSISKSHYHSARIIMCMLGHPPEKINSMHIDHIDGDGLNNRPENLRLVSNRLNSMNRKKRKDNTSGYTGVTWYKPTRSWRAVVSIGGKVKSLGYYKNIEDAAMAVKSARKEDCYTERHGA